MGSPFVSTPVSPSRTTSSQPGALTATAGRPHAAASARTRPCVSVSEAKRNTRSEEHTSELQSPCNLVCRLLLEKKKKKKKDIELHILITYHIVDVPLHH